MGYMENKGVRKGGWVHETKLLQVIGTKSMREKRGIQWDRWKIRVSERVDGSTKTNSHK
jgi:hypothetical protein